MPNITCANNGLTLDDLRQKPGRLVSNQDLAEMGVVKSYDAIKRAIECKNRSKAAPDFGRKAYVIASGATNIL